MLRVHGLQLIPKTQEAEPGGSEFRDSQRNTVRPWSSQAWQHRPVLQSRVNFEASPGYADTMKSWGVPQLHSMKSRV